MNRTLERLRALNAEWNDLPRRLLWIIALFAGLYVCVVGLPYVLPFALAAVFAWMINPMVSWVQRMAGDRKIARNIATIVLVILLTSTVIFLLFVLFARILRELRGLAQVLPEWINALSTQVIDWIQNINLDWPVLENGLDQMLLKMVGDLTSLVSATATRVASTIARGAWRFVGFLPQGILFVVLTLAGTYYMSADKERILSFLRGILPEKYTKRTSLFRASILRAIFGQLRAALVLMVIIFFELSVGFLVIKLDYAILLALVIAILDALPVLGAGLFLIPMAIWGIASANLPLALGGGILYLLTITLHQLMEPRLIGRQLGLYPLATMIAMYAGLRMMGFAGMLLGPLMLLLSKVALSAADDLPMPTNALPPPPRLPEKKKRRRQ